MLNQARGLAEALGLPVEIKTVRPRAPWTYLPVTLWPKPFAALGADSARFVAPWPKTAIGCGWRSIPFMLAIKRASEGRTFTIQLQHPRIDPKHFDLVVPPEHDGLAGANVVSMLGSPNGVTRAKLEDAKARWASTFATLAKPRVAVLIGGASKSYRFDEADALRLATQLKDLAAQGFGVMATTSRRTGDAQTRIIRDTLAATSAFVWDGEGENPYFGLLALADVILVTAESTNMVVEAAATGKPVYIVVIPGGDAKFERLHASLRERGIARTFTGKIEHWTYEPLHETERVARLIRHKLGLPSPVTPA
ncbi:MAG: mitochondrial fission ELM1 family protein [Alphaproteobacteria bacterium]|nr:mitochondrial fission ELM1 family protein [Alphaproteobacteria bacterium]